MLTMLCMPDCVPAHYLLQWPCIDMYLLHAGVTVLESTHLMLCYRETCMNA